MKKTSTAFLIVTLLITLMCIGCFFYFHYYIESLNQKTENLKSDLVTSQIQNVKLESLRLAATSGGGELQKLEKYIIPVGKEVDVVQQIENVAQASSLDHKTESIEEVENQTLSVQNKNLLHIIISTDGNWNNSRKFLSFVEHLPYNVKINVVDMMANGANASSSMIWHSKFDFYLVKNKSI